MAPNKDNTFNSKDDQKLVNIDSLNDDENLPDRKVGILRRELLIPGLSIIQQCYFKEITEACLGQDEVRKTAALQSLTSDPGLDQVLPHVIIFIEEGVRINVVQKELVYLIHLIRMVKAVLDNPSANIMKYLHKLIPSVITCIVSKELCMRPEIDNHWALRDFSSRLLAQICKRYNTVLNDLQTRVTRMFSQALAKTDTIYLTNLYGAIAGLCDLGPYVIKGLVIPRIKDISKRLEVCIESSDSSAVDKNDAEHVKKLLLKYIVPILKLLRFPPDVEENYVMDYGYMGQFLCAAVSSVR